MKDIWSDLKTLNDLRTLGESHSIAMEKKVRKAIHKGILILCDSDTELYNSGIAKYLLDNFRSLRMNKKYGGCGFKIIIRHKKHL